ncbi:hypothetical protein MPTK1_3g08850 [Marchantia polymorpha subsp. ruderalis]|uniref:Uncharacterized protein n=2 Tax=Marchantia polymorpha TaxID=3197 RepID=A0AAF6AYU3_MARPO|nr:hypothetical protein MARPO_0105s0032 [Marchantia polymorpha]BBN04927.1 hypothetical protein Mp_3g08850 [Marchantia polymorpha subsp. ruderalis]|eukprot:PTQ31917.1 hypothetical protein MARPO_0105s0032 [Marchantia polymorpha]
MSKPVAFMPSEGPSAVYIKAKELTNLHQNIHHQESKQQQHRIRHIDAGHLNLSVYTMATEQQRKELDARARAGEEVVPGGRGGKSLEAQEHLAEGRSKGGQTRSSQLGREGYQEMGRKGGLSTSEESGGEAAKSKGINIDESKFKTGTKE